MASYENDPLTEKIIACCFKVHSQLGPGFPERIYHNALKIVLKSEGLRFESEKEFTVKFDGLKVGVFRCDLIVEDKVVAELKAVTGIMPKLFFYKVISYLKATRLKTGLLINFGNTSCENKRISS